MLNSAEYLTDFAKLQQKMTFCGTGAHHQNTTEQAIKTVIRWARTLIIDTTIH